jgi:hypothetical protein
MGKDIVFSTVCISRFDTQNVVVTTPQDVEEMMKAEVEIKVDNFDTG